MLGEGCSVLVRKDGGRTRVENLNIGDLIYDPFAGCYCEITDVLSRKIPCDPKYIEEEHPLHPLVVEKDSLGVGKPQQRLVISPGQPIFLAQHRSTGGGPAVIQLSCARSISNIKKMEDGNWRETQYYALFTESAQFLCVSGLLMSTFTSEVYHSQFTDSTSRIPLIVNR